MAEDGKSWGPRRLLWAAGILLLAMLGVLASIYAGRPGIDSFDVKGIDVSHHQGEIDWGRVGAADVNFAFIKATEGRDHQDTRFSNNWTAAEQAGLIRGAYHFFTFCSPGRDQAEHFLAVVPPTPGALPPVVDVEFAGNCKSWSSIDEIRDELGILLEELEKAWQRRPILYLTSEAERRIVRGHFPGYPVWIRNVLWRPPWTEPGWLFWQYTDEGRVPGIDTPVDLNVYRGGRDELLALIR